MAIKESFTGILKRTTAQPKPMTRAELDTV